MATSVGRATISRATERVRKHREELRARGLQPVTRWVSDTRSPEFQAEYRRQALALAERYRTNPEARAEVAFWKSMQTDGDLA